MGRIKTIALLAGASFERGIDDRDLDDYLHDPRNLVWLDVTDPGARERSVLLDHFAFHPLAVEDSVRGRERPKLDEHAGYFFAVMYGALPGAPPHQTFALGELGLFVGKNYLVTVHAAPLPALDEAFQRFERAGTLLAAGVGYLLYLVLDQLVAGYAPLVDALGEALVEVEESMVSGAAEQRIERLLAIRRHVFQLRRLLHPMREAFAPLLREERALIDAPLRVYLRDVHDHVLRLLDLLDVHREMVAGSIDAALAIVSNRLNMTMKRLTVLSAVLGFAACVFGAWGMNVPGVPASTLAHGFAWIVVATSAVTTAMLVVGWRKGWL